MPVNDAEYRAWRSACQASNPSHEGEVNGRVSDLSANPTRSETAQESTTASGATSASLDQVAAATAPESTGQAPYPTKPINPGLVMAPQGLEVPDTFTPSTLQFAVIGWES